MTHRRMRNHERGYSLTEVLVAVAIFAIVFTAALLVYDRANKIFSAGVNASDVQQTTRVAFDRMVSELRMAGFDYDRDGYPIGAKKYQQPDEQLEFIHPHAITIRSNLNYETGATDNGRETAYEPGFTTTASTTDDYFPVVTTANSEIVTYFLRSDNGPNNDDITFYADVARPRATHPETGAANESLVTIEDVDLCEDGGTLTGCLNPPYTLYRVAIQDNGSVGTPVPIANNIRNMQLAYFADALTTVAITPNGGVGQYKVTGGTTDAAAIAARSLRESVRSIQLTLTGMTPNPDVGYSEPIEAALPTAQQVAAALRHRQYQLRSTIVPRNLGKRGIQEIDVRVPGSPRVTSWLYGGCGVARIAWDAPPVGYVDSYVIIYDTSATGPFNSPVTDAGRNLFGYVGGLDPTQTYYFKVLAKNLSGSAVSINVGGPLTPKNRTKPEPPTLTSATGNPSGPAATANDIRITWNTPALNVTFGGTAPTWSDGSTALTNIPERRPAYTELTGYEIHRSTTSGFTPNNVGGATSTTRIWKGYLTDPGASAVISVASDGLTGSFLDNTAKLACTPYYYKVVAYERCITDAARNDPTNVALAISDPSAEIQGSTIASVAPSAPANVSATAASICNGTTCDVYLEWDRVKTDAASKPILVPQYTVRRRLCNNSGVCGSEQTFTVTDSSPDSTARMTWQETGIAEPASGTRYHYNVAATHCLSGGSLTSAYSTPDVRFPCAFITIAPDGTVLEGDGSATGPWLIASDTATLRATSNTVLSTATARVFAAGGSTALATITGTLSTDRLQATFGYSMPGSNDSYRFEMLLTDTNGCQTGKTSYVQESPSSCCIFPYKYASGTVITPPTGLQAAVSVSGENITIRMQNICDLPLDLTEFKMRWTVGSPQQNMLNSVTYPDGTVDNFGGVADSDGSATLTPPSGARITSGGSYSIVLNMSRRSDTNTSTVYNFCARYTRGGVSESPCQVITVGTVCP